ncbi:Structural maintenance of chromosomes protein 4 [Spathaspora sp. JA1]|nr:Structural maintenance of chromosomes protein 4 [Spathaspora sp. JA1]
MKRKRPTIPDSEDDSTFINNSDYADSNGSPNSPESIVVAPVLKSVGDDTFTTAELHESSLEQEQIIEEEEQENHASYIENSSGKVENDGENLVVDEDASEPSNSDPETEPSIQMATIVNVQEEEANFTTASKQEEGKTNSFIATSPPASPEILAISPINKPDSVVSAPKPEPRLVINKLRLTNFKSYAGEQIIGPFHSSFSAVVGPNGSGKSNVIDSMLFVFGFRASKMRQGKLSELIHNSAGYKPEFCQVDISFHLVIDDPVDPQLSEIVPDSELVVSRKAFRNNQSSYYINGRTSNYTDVTQLLKNKGIDLDHKRFLILQGEVESIAQMKPKAEGNNDDGLLEYLEDIIGTTKYKKLIEDSMLRIDELNDVCLEKANRFDLVEKDKDQLEGKKVEALRFLELEKRLTHANSIQYQVNIYNLNKKIADRQQEANQLNTELQQGREANKGLLEGIEQEVNQQKQIEKEIKNLTSQIDELVKQRKEITKRNVSNEEKVKNLNNKLKKIQKVLETSKHTLNSSNQKLANYADAQKQFKSETDQLNSQLIEEDGKLQEIRQNLTEKTSEFTKAIEALQTKLEPWNNQVKEKDNAIQLAKSNIEILRTQMTSTTKQLDESKEKLLTIKKEGKEKENDYRENEEKLEKIIQQIALGEEQCTAAKNQRDNMRSQVISARSKYQESSNIVSTFQNKNQVLTALLRLAKSGRIDGFYGRLGDLGLIDEKYDVAISTVAGGALDSMVVETVETAQACIDYLRKNNLGYANFICLNKLRSFNLAPIQTPGDPAKVKRLFDLIQPTASKFAPAFYSKLFNTLVAPDLTEAKRVAYGPKRFKVVTLGGQVVDISGAMTGGGDNKARGGMRLTNSRGGDTAADSMLSDKELEEMRSRLNEMESKLEQVNKEYEEKCSMLKKLKDLKPETEFAISRLRLDIEALASEKKEITQVCKNLILEQQRMEKSNPFEQQIKEKEAQVEKLTVERGEIKSEMKVYEMEISNFEQKIMDAGGVELKMQSSKVDSLKNQISIIHEKTSGDRMTVKKLENDIKRHTKNIENATKDQEQTQADLSLIQASQGNEDSQLSEINEKVKQLEISRGDYEDKLEAIKLELEAKQDEINKFKSMEIELENKLEKINSSIKKLHHLIEQDKEHLESIIPRDAKPYLFWLEEQEQAKYDGGIIEQLSEEEIQDVDLDNVNSTIEELEAYMANVKVDIEILKEYGTKIVEYKERKKDLNQAVEERDVSKDYCEDMKRKRLDEFMVGFNTISMTLKDMYRMITMGGNAELELVDSLDPFSEGILFSVMPPKKSWKNISNLSGGEKTLSSLALVFALHTYKPTPLYVMDEIDAALDFRNVSIVANYIKERTKNAQFVVISLRNNMFELAQQLVGIYKVNNMTKSISMGNIDISNFNFGKVSRV